MIKSVVELPFNRYVGIERSHSADALLVLPAGDQYLNHLGTVHASAQLALAEASSGEYLLGVLGSTSGLVAMVRRMEAKFSKPASGPLKGNVIPMLESRESIQSLVAEKGRCIVSIEVVIIDALGTKTLAASFDWFITKVATLDREGA